MDKQILYFNSFRSKMIVGNGRVMSSTYEWDINDYSSYSNLETGKYIRSPPFNAQCSLWYIKLYPNGETQDVQGSVSLCLFMSKDTHDVGEIQAQFAFTCIDSKKEVVATYSSKTHLCYFDKRGWGKMNFMNKSLLIDITSGNSSGGITIVCELNIKEAKFYKTLLTVSADKVQHFEEFKSQLNNPKFSDVKFIVQNKEIHAHKMVLVAKSAVFAAMFEHEMRENKENKVTIKDMSYKAFSELLNFMYTGECTMSKDLVCELFKAADKYQLLKLKDMCEEELCRNITVSNVIAVLQLGDMYNNVRLKKEAIDFIVLHGKEIIDEPQFESIENPKLLKDILKGIYSNKN